MKKRNVLFEKARMKYSQLCRHASTALKSLFQRRHPDDPYAMVGARERPRLPRRSGSVAVDPRDC